MRRALRAQLIRAKWAQHLEERGTLYSPAFDAVEAGAIRDECELIGLPMGYGRVGREPRQLNDDEARGQTRGRWPRAKR